MKKLNKKGFTIVELVIVIAVIAILAGVLIPTFATVVTKANQSKAMQEAKNEYEAYLAEYAATLTGDKNYVIVAGDYAFEVTNGQFNSEAKDKSKFATNKVDLSAYKQTTDTAPQTDKTYYTESNGKMTEVSSFEGNKFAEGTTYYEASEVGSAKVFIYAAN